MDESMQRAPVVMDKSTQRAPVVKGSNRQTAPVGTIGEMARREAPRATGAER
ncbi:MAG: hypothetical protein R3E87_18375 [Burkholderiaceae bacterium]